MWNRLASIVPHTPQPAAGARRRRRLAAVLGATTALVMLAGACVAEAQEAGMIKALTQGYNAAGLALYRTLARTPGNVVLSPYSIGTVMAMVRSGARGETELELARALQHSLPRDAIDAANRHVLGLLKAYDRSTEPRCHGAMHWSGKVCQTMPDDLGACPPLATRQGSSCVAPPLPLPPSATLVTANALVLPKDAGGVAEAYASLLRHSYAAEVLHGRGVDDINHWVAQRTAGKIDRIVDTLPDAAGPVLLNAVYLKAAWAAPFAKSATRDADFSLSAAARVRVPTMHRQAELAVVERPGYRALRLDYAERALGLIVVLPDAVEGADDVTRRLDAAELAQLTAALKAAQARPVAVALPRFKAAFSADLVAPFQQAGVRLAFTDAADFSGMTGGSIGAGGLKIAGIRHRTAIEVDERGTEAAAATAVTMLRTSAPFQAPPPVPFVVDHPFLFLVVDDASGAVLFQGRIADPR